MVPREAGEGELELARVDRRQRRRGVEHEGLVAACGREDVDLHSSGPRVALVDAEEVWLPVVVEARHIELPLVGVDRAEGGGRVEDELGVVGLLG